MLSYHHRYEDIRQRDAAEALREATPEAAEAAVEQFEELGLVREFDRVDTAHEAIVADWVELVEQREAARMCAEPTASWTI